MLSESRIFFNSLFCTSSSWCKKANIVLDLNGLSFYRPKVDLKKLVGLLLPELEKYYKSAVLKKTDPFRLSVKGTVCPHVKNHRKQPCPFSLLCYPVSPNPSVSTSRRRESILQREEDTSRGITERGEHDNAEGLGKARYLRPRIRCG